MRLFSEVKFFCLRFIGLALVGIIFIAPVHAKEFKFSSISFQEYLDIVRQNNAFIGIGALDIKTAEAIKEADSLYRFAPSVSYYRGAYMNQIPYTGYSTPASSTYGLNFTIEGWGKRSARENLAQAKTEASAVQLEKNKSIIELYAITAYINTLQQSLLIKSYTNALDKLKNLPKNAKTTDAENFLKSNRSFTEDSLVFSSQSMRSYSGDALQSLPLPTGSLNYPTEEYNLQDFITLGQTQSVEVLELQSAIEVADKNITLTEKNRNVDIRPYIAQTRTPAYQYSNGINQITVNTTNYGSATVSSPGAAYSAQNSTTLGVSIPIPVNNYLQTADIVSAANAKLQYEMKLRDLKVQIEVKVTQAFIEYGRAKIRLQAAQKAYESVVKTPNKNPLVAIMEQRDKEGALVDAKAEHLKGLVKLWWQCGNYSAPNI